MLGASRASGKKHRIPMLLHIGIYAGGDRDWFEVAAVPLYPLGPYPVATCPRDLAPPAGPVGLTLG